MVTKKVLVRSTPTGRLKAKKEAMQHTNKAAPQKRGAGRYHRGVIKSDSHGAPFVIPKRSRKIMFHEFNKPEMMREIRGLERVHEKKGGGPHHYTNIIKGSMAMNVAGR